MDDDLFDGYGIEIRLNKPEDFLKVVETLTRIGIGVKNPEPTLYQSCHILHKRGRYAILHFKELFALDGKDDTFSLEDEGRRNTIVKMLEDWKLITILDEFSDGDPFEHRSKVLVIQHKDKSRWKLVPKYQIGKRKRSSGQTPTAG